MFAMMVVGEKRLLKCASFYLHGSFDFPPWLRLHFWSQLDADNKANVSQTLTETEVPHSAGMN